MAHMEDFRKALSERIEAGRGAARHHNDALDDRPARRRAFRADMKTRKLARRRKP